MNNNQDILETLKNIDNKLDKLLYILQMDLICSQIKPTENINREDIKKQITELKEIYKELFN